MATIAELQQEPIRRLTRAEYDRLVGQGWFEDERVELLHGMLLHMPPERPPHAHTVDTLNERLVPALLGRAKIRIQHPLLAADESEPEPDVAVVPPGAYRTEHPAEAWLVIEVARTSQHRDRVLKAPLYAASGFEEYWLIDLPARRVEIYREPEDGRYRKMETFRPGQEIAPARFPDVSLRVDELVG